MQDVQITPQIIIGDKHPLAIIAGPCVIEEESLMLDVAFELKNIFSSFGFSFIFKSSFDKANRSAKDSYRGPGLEKGLKILQKIKKECDLPIITDIHLPEQAQEIAEICDMIQIPAFLCRQTDLIVASANTKLPIMAKKGQFLSPWDMKNVIEKIESTNNKKIILCDRGTSFGYNNLVSDFRCIPIMQSFGYPVCFDATHSVQLPGGLGNASGGQREFIPILAKAAIAAGANALFLETHPKPEKAKSDAASQFPLSHLNFLLKDIEKIYNAVKK